MAAAVVISDGLNRDRRSSMPGPGVYVMAGEYELTTGNLADTDDKVILDYERLPAPMQEALRHLHEAEYRQYRAADPEQGTPDEES